MRQLRLASSKCPCQTSRYSWCLEQNGLFHPFDLIWWLFVTQTNHWKRKVFVNKMICKRITVACFVKQRNNCCYLQTFCGFKRLYDIMDKCCQANAKLNLTIQRNGLYLLVYSVGSLKVCVCGLLRYFFRPVITYVWNNILIVVVFFLTMWTVALAVPSNHKYMMRKKNQIVVRIFASETSFLQLESGTKQARIMRWIGWCGPKGSLMIGSLGIFRALFRVMNDPILDFLLSLALCRCHSVSGVQLFI